MTEEERSVWNQDVVFGVGDVSGRRTANARAV